MGEDKISLRKRALAARATAHRAGASPAARLTEVLSEVAGLTVAGYVAIRDEADPMPALTALAARNRLCLPVVMGRDRPLGFRAWVPGAPLIPGAFGAAVPPPEAAEVVPDLLIVPLVAFDAAGNRLGYGGGYYDRTLGALRAAGTVRAIGLAYAAQELSAIPVEPTDQRLDAVVTEAGVAGPGACNVPP